jgi:hypothetical protein
VNPAKVTAINEWPVPQKLKDVESFLGMINFWWKFIKDFSAIACPLHKLKKKDVPFEWTKAHQDAFDALKQALVTALILKILWENLLYLLETDASGFALGAVLSQCHDGSGTPSTFIPGPSYQQNRITRPMIRSFWRSSIHLRSGSIYSKVPSTMCLFIPTIWHSSIS